MTAEFSRQDELGPRRGRRPSAPHSIGIGGILPPDENPCKVQVVLKSTHCVTPGARLSRGIDGTAIPGRYLICLGGLCPPRSTNVSCWVELFGPDGPGRKALVAGHTLANVARHRQCRLRLGPAKRAPKQRHVVRACWPGCRVGMPGFARQQHNHHCVSFAAETRVTKP